MTDADLLQGIIGDPLATDRWLILADWLEEHDDPRRAELLRLHRRLLATCTEPDKHPERSAWQSQVVALLAKGVQPVVPRQTIALAEGVDLTFAWIPPGTFLMGSPKNEPQRYSDETQHRVTLTQGFWLGIHPVTQAQWQAVMGSNPSHFKGDDLPVETVSWNDCQEFVNRLGEGFRLPTEAEWEHACRAGTATPFWWGDQASSVEANFDGNYPYIGAAGSAVRGVYLERTTPVGSYQANPFGLYDMHGNVWEWCQDPWRREYRPDPTGSSGAAAGTTSAPVARRRSAAGTRPRAGSAASASGLPEGEHRPDPTRARTGSSGAAAGTSAAPIARRRSATGTRPRSGATTSASDLPEGERPGRVFRGGSWGSAARNCRSASRYGDDPSFRNGGLGVRLARG